MCKSQRDIEVEQQRQWRASKKEQDLIKLMHNSMNIQPPRSPISPSPPEVEIPSVEDRVGRYFSFWYFEQYGNLFYLDVGASSSFVPPPPGQDVFGTYLEYSYGAARTSYEPHRPSEADQFTARASNAVFAPPFGTHWSDQSSLDGNGGNG